ncbi:MAG TPA: hypothetical protein VG452_10595 [Egibacteraceae bacterium]|nr:hypothetical protein [Egibacteraceae bacterium]
MAHVRAAARSAPVGHMVTARIIGADGVDLVGEPPGARAASGQPGC